MVDAAVANLFVCVKFIYLLLVSVASLGCSKMGLGEPSLPCVSQSSWAWGMTQVMWF